MQRFVVVACLLAACMFGAANAQAKFPNFVAALNQPSYSRLNQVVDGLGLKQTFTNPALKVTVFVPNDAAFAAVERRTGISIGLLMRQRSLMQQVVYYHIVKEVVKAPIPQGKVMPTFVSGRSLTGAGMSVKGAGSSIAKIVQPNIQCGAGIAHGVDSVILFLNIGR